MQRTRFVFIAMSMVALLAISGASFGQTSKQLGTVKLGYAKMPKININSVQPPSSSIRLVLPKGVSQHSRRLRQRCQLGRRWPIQ